MSSSLRFLSSKIQTYVVESKEKEGFKVLIELDGGPVVMFNEELNQRVAIDNEGRELVWKD